MPRGASGGSLLRELEPLPGPAPSFRIGSLFMFMFALLCLVFDVFLSHRDLAAGMPVQLFSCDRCDEEYHRLRSGNKDTVSSCTSSLH